MTDQSINHAIHSVFDPVVGSENVSIFDKREPIFVTIQQPSSSCIYLELYIYTSGEKKNNIHIHNIDNCKEQRKGREFLMLVEELAQQIGSKEISLADASKIKFEYSSVSLKTLYCLTTGQSWYNSLGYICLDNRYGTHERNYEANKRKISTMKISDFIEEVKHNTHDRDTEEMIDELFRETTETYRELNPEMTIQEYFTIVKKILQENARDGVQLLAKLLFNIESSDAISISVSDCLLVKVMGSSPLIKDISIKKATISGGRKLKKNKNTKRRSRRLNRKKSRRR